MSWYNPGSFNPFQGLSNGTNGGAVNQDPIVANSSTGSAFEAMKTMGDQIGHTIDTEKARQTAESFINDYLDKSVSNTTSSAKDSADTKSAIDSYLDYYKTTGDDAWLEKYIDSIVERENTASAREYETEMSNTSFSRLIADIQRAGYNPWLALQSSIGQATTPAVSAAGRSDISYSSQKNQRAISASDREANSITRVIGTVGIVLAAILRAVL